MSAGCVEHLVLALPEDTDARAGLLCAALDLLAGGVDVFETDLPLGEGAGWPPPARQALDVLLALADSDQRPPGQRRARHYQRTRTPGYASTGLLHRTTRPAGGSPGGGGGVAHDGAYGGATGEAGDGADGNADRGDGGGGQDEWAAFTWVAPYAYDASAWSPDGQRVAWCSDIGTAAGFTLTLEQLDAVSAALAPAQLVPLATYEAAVQAHRRGRRGWSRSLRRPTGAGAAAAGVAVAEQTCRVCGLDEGEVRWDEHGLGSYVICSCCEAESGLDDVDAAAVLAYRGGWLLAGGRWRYPEQRPAGWLLAVSLRQVPAAFR